MFHSYMLSHVVSHMRLRFLLALLTLAVQYLDVMTVGFLLYDVSIT